MEKKIKMSMSIMMGVTLSLCLSFVGTFTSGSFTPAAFLVSFLESLVISLVIGCIVPIKKAEDSACEKVGVKSPMGRRTVGSFVSDLIYTPVITTAMVTINFFKIPIAHRPPYIIMWGKSMVISFIVAYLIVFLVGDNYMRMILKKYGITGRPPEGRK